MRRRCPTSCAPSSPCDHHVHLCQTGRRVRTKIERYASTEIYMGNCRRTM
jgi:hypothetical protein